MGLIFGAICPARLGAGHGGAPHDLSIPAHAVLIVDQAGWHLTPKLAIPDNITVLALPPRSPELNPVEKQFMRHF